MKHTLLTLIAVLLLLTATAQVRIGAEAGIGGPIGYAPDLNLFDSHIKQQANYLRPCFGITYHNKVSRHIFVGGRLGYNTWSFNNTQGTLHGLFDLFATNPLYTDGTQTVCQAHYITLAPLADAGIGRRQHLHVFVMPGIGVLAGGTMSTRTYETHDVRPEPTDYDNTVNTSAHLNTITVPISYGLTEHISLSSEWHITISETITSLLSNIAAPQWTGNNHLPRGYASLQLGVMRKYRSR